MAVIRWAKARGGTGAGSKNPLRLLCALALIMACCALCVCCGGKQAGETPANSQTAEAPGTTSLPAESETPAPESTEAVAETPAPQVTEAPFPTETGYAYFSRCGRSDRIPNYLGPELYADYCRLLDALYNCADGTTLANCASYEEFARVSACVRLAFIPRDLLRDPGFLTVTPFAFDPDSRYVDIFYCWEDGTLAAEELPCAGPSDYAEKLRVFKDTVEGIMRDCDIDLSDHADSAKKLFDWVSDNLYYEINRNDTAFTAFENHRGYCSIYAEVYQFLAEEAGVECMRISGAVSMGWGDHEWDLIRIGGSWFHADATFQGSDNYADGYYFGMSDAICAALGHGSAGDFRLSDELSLGEEKPECADTAFDEVYRSWMVSEPQTGKGLEISYIFIFETFWHPGSFSIQETIPCFCTAHAGTRRGSANDGRKI